ncbi:MAG: Mov34/MPN/PAD-1 family protein [Chloroflexi bacterium]|nr:Mov34/MPN/PAD-1 family protein [Chloroflexota bacterium]
MVQFSAQAWRTMLAFRQLRSDQLEAGGILIGRVIRGSGDVVVDVITVPGPRDERRRTAFVRRDSSHQAALDAAWATSGATKGYLGEWHSHPERVPRPSDIDAAGWMQRTAEAPIAGTLFFAIVGSQEVGVWQCQKSEEEMGTPQKLSAPKGAPISPSGPSVSSGDSRGVGVSSGDATSRSTRTG